MDLTIGYDKASSQSEAYELAKEAITPEYVAKFNVNADITHSPEKGQIVAKGKGFTLSLFFGENECNVKLELSFLLKPLRKTILEKVENKVRKTL